MSQLITRDISKFREDFPIFGREIRPGIPLVYLDSTATSQKPLAVINAMDQYYQKSNANIHRGIHFLAEEATELYENSRKNIAKFINAESSRQIIFTRNTTESINLVANAWGRFFLNKGDTILLTEMEHHSNLVPWQIIAAEKGAQLEFIPVTEEGYLDLSIYKTLLETQPKLVAFTQMSNVLGTINPAKQIVQMAHAAGAITLIDAAQSVPHLSVDVVDLDVDFLAFSAHKMCGPTGIGVLYGKKEILNAIPPFLGGGDMIKRVTLRSYSPNELPHKFEAGTPAIAEAIGFNAAIDYLRVVGMDEVQSYEHELISYALERLEEIPGLRVIGPKSNDRGGVVAFTLTGIHPHDIAQILDRYGIAVRAGHHCAMPLHDRYNLPATTRASFYLYNRLDEIDTLIKGIYKVKEFFT